MAPVCRERQASPATPGLEGGVKGRRKAHCSTDIKMQGKKAQMLPPLASSSDLGGNLWGEERDGRGPSTLMRRSGNRPNLAIGLVQKSTETTGARAKNTLILLASSGICENAIKPVRTKGRKQEFHLLGFPSQETQRPALSWRPETHASTTTGRRQNT